MPGIVLDNRNKETKEVEKLPDVAGLTVHSGINKYAVPGDGGTTDEK